MSTQTTPDQAADRYHFRNGARLRWRLDGEGPALALLHGWALDLAYWDPVASLLIPRFSVLRFDRSGFGLSAGPADIHRNVDDLAALLDAAGIARIVLIGMSQGARLAIHFARSQPARTRALVLDGAPALETEPELPFDDYRHKLGASGAAQLHAAVLAHPLMQLVTGDSAARTRLAEIVARYPGTDLRQPLVHAPAPDLGAISAPVLVINGALDSAARIAAGRDLQARIPGAKRVELPGAGHLAALDDPARYAAVITAFCDNLPA